MSDPFENLDNEVYLDKIKKFFYKFKLLIISISTLLILFTAGLVLFNNAKKKEIDKISNYYIQILSIVDNDPERAKNELKKLTKLSNRDYKNLSNLLIFKLQFQNNEFKESLKTLKEVEKNIKVNSHLNKIIKYYYAQVAMEQGIQKDFEIFTKDLLSFGGMWALLAHELRGHLYFSKSDYDNALKNFNKIIQNQQATVTIKNRALEMIDNINLYYDKNS
ncbi:MAG: hypothetical protein CMJ06_03600 [Pelagibacterales bacterium]|nr:hypothetical protein [Pelagibacterales bacterium]OUU62238.1 MAG: hypothetical protein CBC22_05050 [Alphaproteobacteria bacterium TMED62]